MASEDYIRQMMEEMNRMQARIEELSSLAAQPAQPANPASEPARIAELDQDSFDRLVIRDVARDAHPPEFTGTVNRDAFVAWRKKCVKLVRIGGYDDFHAVRAVWRTLQDKALTTAEKILEGKETTYAACLAARRFPISFNDLLGAMQELGAPPHTENQAWAELVKLQLSRPLAASHDAFHRFAALFSPDYDPELIPAFHRMWEIYLAKCPAEFRKDMTKRADAKLSRKRGFPLSDLMALHEASESSAAIRTASVAAESSLPANPQLVATASNLIPGPMDTSVNAVTAAPDAVTRADLVEIFAAFAASGRAFSGSCFSCGKRGHMARDCRGPRKAQKSSGKV